jgi:peptidyl-prolyl cis-trans isomerase B (cyclophilin B)
VSAVLIPGERDSGGSQFFISVTDQPALDGQYTVFARVVEGIAVAQAISMVAANGDIPAERIELRTVTIRDTPAPEPEPFSTETIEQLARTRAVIETSLGNLTVELFPDRAPNHVRQFLRLAASGAFDGTAFHRVVPGFVIQGGHMPTRREPLTERQEAFVRNLAPEFNDTEHELGTLSMARGEDPASATTSFFIVLDRASNLDGQYTAFGRVVEGLDVVQRIAGAALAGDAPVERIEVVRVTVR